MTNAQLPAKKLRKEVTFVISGKQTYRISYLLDSISENY